MNELHSSPNWREEGAVTLKQDCECLDSFVKKTSEEHEKKRQKLCIREALTLSMCADNIIVSKKVNKLFGSDLEHLYLFKALQEDDPRDKHLPGVDNLLVQSGIIPCL